MLAAAVNNGRPRSLFFCYCWRRASQHLSRHVLYISAHMLTDINTHTLSMIKTGPCFVFVSGKITARLHNGARLTHTPRAPPPPPLPPLLSPIRAFFLGKERANSSRQSSREGVAMQLCLLWQKVNINFHQWGKFTHMILFVLHY